MRRRGALAALAAVVMAGVAAQPAAAGIWSPVSSGTTSEISAIEYQAADRFWFTTRTGEIFKRQPDGSFALKHGPTAIPLNDIEFQPTSGLGFAVGNNGQVLRSANGGESWSAIDAIPVSKQSTPTADCTGSEPFGNVNAVRFAGPSRVFLFARGAQVARSTNANKLGGQGQWRDANRDTQGTADPADDTCKLTTDSNAGISDAFFAPSSTNVGYITTGHFGETFFTDDALNSATEQPARSGNGSFPNRRMAGDPASPNRMWVVVPGGGDISFTGTTTDGWATSGHFLLGNPAARLFTAPHDVDFAGGTVLVAGDAGMVLNSTDGKTFHFNGADAPLAATDWRAAALASGTEGAIGGAGGALALTTAANTLPPPPGAPPPGGAKVYKTPTVKLRVRYFRPRRSTMFVTVAVTGVPRGSKVVGRCLTRRAKRCATRRLRRTFTKGNARGTVRLKRFERRRLRAGTRLEVVVTHPDYLSQIKTVTVRRGRPPLISTRCQRPGEPQRRRC